MPASAYGAAPRRQELRSPRTGDLAPTPPPWRRWSSSMAARSSQRPADPGAPAYLAVLVPLRAGSRRRQGRTQASRQDPCGPVAV